MRKVDKRIWMGKLQAITRTAFLLATIISPSRGGWDLPALKTLMRRGRIRSYRQLYRRGHSVSFVRHYQRAVTGVLPHVQNTRYAVPKRQIVNNFVTPAMFIGDSIMAGAGGFGAGDYEAVGDYIPSLPRASQSNRAVGGRTLAVVDSQFATDLAASPGTTCVVCLAGINDIVLDATSSAMQTSAKSIIAKAQAADLPIVLVDPLPWNGPGSPANWTQTRQDTLDDYRTEMQQYILQAGDEVHWCSAKSVTDPDDYTRKKAEFSRRALARIST